MGIWKNVSEIQAEIDHTCKLINRCERALYFKQGKVKHRIYSNASETLRHDLNDLLNCREVLRRNESDCA